MKQWKDISWYEWLYQINYLGEVKSLSRFNAVKERILKPWVCWKEGNKYHRVSLTRDFKPKFYWVHRLVAQAFLWLDIHNRKILVCHKDDNSLNNTIDNLFLWSQKDNLQDMSKKWRSWNQWKFWKNNTNSKKVNQYTLKLEFIKTWDCILDVQRELKIKHTSIINCCRWRSRHSWNFIWKYL